MPNAATSKTVIIYRNVAGKEPFTHWINGLSDPGTRRRILKRLWRVERGNYGDCKMVGGGIKNYASSLAQDTAFTLVKMAIKLWFYSAAAIKTASVAIYNKPKSIGRSI